MCKPYNIIPGWALLTLLCAIMQRRYIRKIMAKDHYLQQIAFLLNTRRDVPGERLYRVLGFMHVPPKPEICCMFVHSLIFLLSYPSSGYSSHS